MGKPGVKPKGKVKIRWSSEFAYVIGLITTDGNLSPNGRTINFTSKDKELVLLFRKVLGVTNKIGRKARGSGEEKKYFVIQVGDILFYHFLESIGLMRRKSKILAGVHIPEKYFFDFLRGHFDGDGTFYSYWDKRWRSSFMFYLYFYSASKRHIKWIRAENKKYLGVIGHVAKAKLDSTYSLRYAKAETLILLRQIYKNKKPCLGRKYLKIQKALGILSRSI